MNIKEKRALIRDLILNMDTPFTMEDVIAVTQKHNVFDAALIPEIMIDLCESGLLIRVGDLFYMPKDALLNR